MRPGATTGINWRSVFAGCLEPGSLVESDGSRLCLPGAGGTSLILTGWNCSHAAIRIRDQPGSHGVGHLPGIAEGANRRRIADYILFTEVEGAHYAIMVEMKKTLHPGDRRAYLQVRATRPVAAYLTTLAQNEGGHSGPVVFRHVVVAAEREDRIPKTPPRPRLIEAGCRFDEAGVQGLRFLAGQLPVEALVADPEQRCECPEEQRPGR